LCQFDRLVTVQVMKACSLRRPRPGPSPLPLNLAGALTSGPRSRLYVSALSDLCPRSISAIRVVARFRTHCNAGCLSVCLSVE